MTASVGYAITDHVEGPAETSSAHIYDEVIRMVELADSLEFDYAWFGEHHAYAHQSHLPHPLLLALHLATRTHRISLGSTVICVNLHHPLLLAEQIAMADVLSGGRMSIGLGSGSTPGEIALYGASEMDPDERRARFVETLDLLERAWSGEPLSGDARLLPRPCRDLRAALWIGANSLETARLAGERGYGLMLSNLRTSDDLCSLIEAYRRGRTSSDRLAGPDRVAASAPLYCDSDDAAALAEFEPALDLLVREARRGSVPAGTPREQVAALRFTVGGPTRCLEELLALRERVPFNVLNIRPRWQGLSAAQVGRSLRTFREYVRPGLDAAWSNE